MARPYRLAAATVVICCAPRASPCRSVVPELRGLIDKTAGVVPTLQTILRPFEGRIACAFVYGSVARSEEHAASDIDVLVVGDVGLAELTPTLRKAEARLGREVNVTSYYGVPSK